MSLHISKSDIEAARVIGPRIVVIGGGTGLSAMLRGLKLCSDNITAIVAVSDDGGGSGCLRQDLGMLPPGDIRNCLLALANAEPSMCQLLNYRFSEGRLAGQSFGNLFLAALNGICDSFEQAVQRMGEVLAITGRVLPVTTENIHLEAEFDDGNSIVGETSIVEYKKTMHSKIKRVGLIPEKPKAYDQAVAAIEEAELIVLGPGSLYTSVIPNVLVAGISDAIKTSQALKVYVCNVMTQEGETDGYTAFDHIQSIMEHSAQELVDVCLVNSLSIPENIAEKYKAESSVPVVVDSERFESCGIKMVEKPLADFETELARHNSIKLACELIDLLCSERPRNGVCGKYDGIMLDWVRIRAGKPYRAFQEVT